MNQRQKQKAQKRGGAQRVISLDFPDGERRYALEPAHHKTAEVLFDEQWAVTLVNRVLELLRNDSAAHGKETEFDVLKQYLTGQTKGLRYAEAAKSLSMSEGAARVLVHRLRKRYQELLRAEIAQTVSTPAEVDDEIRCLFACFGSR